MSASRQYYYTTTSGSSLFVEENGSSKPLMVLMHGLGGSTNAFQPLIKHFESSYTMLRFDFPGSGHSTFAGKLSISSLVSDLEDIVASKNLPQPPILIGHSLGSIVAMHYAAKHPTKALVLIGPGRSASHIPAVVERMSNLARSAEAGMEYMMDATVANNVASTSSDLVRAMVRQMIASQKAQGYAATCRAVCAGSHKDPDYAAIMCPALLIAGDQDNISPLSRSTGLAKLIGPSKNGAKVCVVHSGHQQVLEDTEGVVAAVNAFLDAL